jgi:hypothetical protein
MAQLAIGAYRTAAELRDAELDYLARERAGGVVLSPPPSADWPGVRLARAIEAARWLFGVTIVA